MNTRLLSIRSLASAAWSMYKHHWQVFLIASLVPFVFSLLQRFLFDSGSLLGSVAAFIAVITGFLSYYYQTQYAIAVSENRGEHWRNTLQSVTISRVWRVLRANIWMVFIIVWPMFVLVFVAGILGFLIGQDSFTGTTLSLIAMGVAAVVGAIMSFVRSLSYTLMLYLAFTTNARVRTLHTTSKNHMRGNRVKFLKVVLIQILLGIIAAFTLVLLPVVQSLVYIVMVIFAQRVLHARSHTEHVHHAAEPVES